MSVPNNDWFMRENPTKMDGVGGTPILGHLHTDLNLLKNAGKDQGAFQLRIHPRLGVVPRANVPVLRQSAAAPGKLLGQDPNCPGCHRVPRIRVDVTSDFC